jgi:nitrogen fixation protein FixH
MTGTRPAPTERARPGPWDRWIPWAFVAFLAAVLAANGTMIAVAVATWPGLETADAYRKGIEYNAVLEAAREQAALGWRVELAFVPAAEGGQRGRLELRVADALGQPIERAEVQAGFSRPTQAGHDFGVSLDSEGGGAYCSRPRSRCPASGTCG